MNRETISGTIDSDRADSSPADSSAAARIEEHRGDLEQTATATTNHNHQFWPAERFYWALVDEAVGSLKAGPLPPGLWPILEDQTPHALHELQAVAARLADGQAVICAAPISEIQPLRSRATHLTPASLPEFISLHDDSNSLPSQLNLLVGRCEPHSRRRERLRTHAVAACTVLLCSLLVGAGFYRRAEVDARSAEHAAALAQQSRDAVQVGITGEALGEHIERLGLLRQLTQQASPIQDVSHDLASLLSAWPTDAAPSVSNLKVIPQSLDVSSNAMHVSLTVAGDPSSFLTSLRPPSGWRLSEPRLSAQSEVVRVELSFLPSGSPAKQPISAPGATP